MATCTYDVFGELLESTGEVENDYLFAGKQFNGELDIITMQGGWGLAQVFANIFANMRMAKAIGEGGEGWRGYNNGHWFSC